MEWILMELNLNQLNFQLSVSVLTTKLKRGTRHQHTTRNRCSTNCCSTNRYSTKKSFCRRVFLIYPFFSYLQQEGNTAVRDLWEKLDTYDVKETRSINWDNIEMYKIQNMTLEVLSAYRTGPHEACILLQLPLHIWPPETAYFNRNQYPKKLALSTI